MTMRLLFVLGSGGHTTHSLDLAKRINHEKFYIVPWESPSTKELVGKSYFSVISPRFKAKDNRFLSIFRTLFLMLHCLLILMIVRPNIIVSTGPGIALLPFLIAPTFGIKTIFAETPSRVYFPSITGKALIGKVTLWLSSWIDLAQRYEQIEYKGMIV